MDAAMDFLTSWTFLFILIGVLMVFMVALPVVIVAIVVRLASRPQGRLPNGGDSTDR